MEWRYHHVKMVERTIGTKIGHGRLRRASTCARRCTSRSSPTSGRSAASFEPRPRRALLGLSRLRAAAPDGPLAPGVARRRARGAAGGVAGRGRARGPQVGARVREGGAAARRRPAAARRPRRAGRARRRTRTSSCCGSCPRCRCASGRSSSRPTASSTRCGASSGGWRRRGSRSCGSRRGRWRRLPSGSRPRLPARARCSSRRCSSRTRASCPGCRRWRTACADAGAELLVDAYHALGCLPFTVAGLERAWIVGGGYKYLQLGEGNCFLRLPPPGGRAAARDHGLVRGVRRAARRRTVPGATPYPRGSMRFAGSTYDPTSHYRAARVLDFFDEQGLTPERLRESYLHQTTLLAERFDELGLADVTRDRETPLERLRRVHRLRVGARRGAQPSAARRGRRHGQPRPAPALRARAVPLGRAARGRHRALGRVAAG